jgi:hypothetical protein
LSAPVSSHPTPAPAPAVPQVMLPSIEIQTLQAELSLQKLSKEIIYLRNQQRESLRLRRLEIVEKKKRAQGRRESYLEEMSQLQFQLKETVERNHHLIETVELNEQKIKVMEGNHELLTEQNREYGEMIERLQRELSDSQQLCERLREEKESYEKERLEEKEQWVSEKETMRREKVFLELQLETLSKSNEKNEQR